MAPLPVIADVFRCAWRWHHSDLGTDAVNVMHLRNTSAAPPDIATVIGAHVAANMWAHGDNHAVCTQIDITPLDGSGASYAYLTGGGTGFHGVATTVHDVVPQSCPVVKLTTAKRGRSYRGRLFLPWPVDAANTNGKLEATSKAAMQTAWDSFHTGLVGAGTELVVASYKLSSAENVTGVLIEQYLATQRRRLHRTSL